MQRPQRRRQPEEQRRHDGQQQREGDDRQIETDRRQRRQARRIDARQHAQRGGGEPDPQHGADDGEHDAFGEQLPHQTLRRRAERRSHRHLAHARVAAHQQQVRHVDARDQQQEADRAHQQPHRGPQLAANLLIEPHRKGRELHLRGHTRPARSAAV